MAESEKNRVGWVERAETAFSYLREGLMPEIWEHEVQWMNPYNLSREEQNVQLAKVAVWGLALTAAPQAAEVLNSFKQTTASAELAAGESGTQPLGDLVEEALRYHASIAE